MKISSTKWSDKVRAFSTTIKVRKCIKQFEKEFLKIMDGYDVETKIRMYQLCLEEFRSTIAKKFN